MTDEELAKQLVVEGWYSTSNKYRHISRWSMPVPRVEDLIRPEMLNAPHVDRLIKMWNKSMYHERDLRSNHPLIEDKELTEEQFKLFRKYGGVSA